MAARGEEPTESALVVEGGTRCGHTVVSVTVGHGISLDPALADLERPGARGDASQTERGCGGAVGHPSGAPWQVTSCGWAP